MNDWPALVEICTPLDDPITIFVPSLEDEIVLCMEKASALVHLRAGAASHSWRAACPHIWPPPVRAVATQRLAEAFRPISLQPTGAAGIRPEAAAGA